MGIECDGQKKAVTKDDGEISVKAGSIHQFFIHPDSPGDMTVYLSASDAGMDFQLDRIFFENWYGYWHDALLHDGGLSILQYLAVCAPYILYINTRNRGPFLCNFPTNTPKHRLPPIQIQDGGDAYTPAPAWVPFRRTVGYWTCVVLGRWIGGLLGYKPFFKEYTTDWDYAVAKMKGSFFQRHLVEESFAVAKTWPEQVRLCEGGKPANAEFEEWTTQLEEQEGRVKWAGKVNGVGKGCKVNGVAKENGNGTVKVNGFLDEVDDEEEEESDRPGIKLKK